MVKKREFVYAIYYGCPLYSDKSLNLINKEVFYVKTKYTAMIKRMARSLTAMVLLLSCMLTSASASTVIRREQEQKKWCWAACAQMVGHTITGRLFSQSDICKYVKGGIIRPCLKNRGRCTKSTK